MLQLPAYVSLQQRDHASAAHQRPIRPRTKAERQPHPTPSPRLSPDGTLVESKLLTLEHVTIATTALARTASNDGVETRSLKLPLERGVDLAALLEPLRLLGLDALALLLILALRLLLPSPAQRLAVVRLPPLTERAGVDLDDGRLGQGVCADELVVGGVEGDADDTHFARDALAAPGEVAGVETQRAELAVAAARAYEMDAFRADTGVGRLTALLESPAESQTIR